MVSVLGNYYYEFPKPIKLELCVNDILEKEVPEKYYISEDKVKKLLSCKPYLIPERVKKEELVCYNQFNEDGVQTSLNDRIYDSKATGLAVTTSPFFMPNYLVYNNHKYRIRKLMPIECYKLMGFTRNDFFKVKEAGISEIQCYKQAGNSIVVDVLEAIFRNMNIRYKRL